MRVFLIFVSIILFASQAFAGKSKVTATELNQYCMEVDKNSLGNDFDKALAQQCRGYMDAFFDSMIIVSSVSGKPPFCIPNELPKIQTDLILRSWVDKNKKIASQTTAAVALYAAFKNAYPCN